MTEENMDKTYNYVGMFSTETSLYGNRSEVNYKSKNLVYEVFFDDNIINNKGTNGSC